MRTAHSIVLFGIISFCLMYSATVCSASDCYQCIENVDLPFEIYHGRNGIFLRSNQFNDKPSDKESPFLEYHDVQVIQLCDQHFAAVWMSSHYRYSIPLTGRIFDKQLRTISGDFPISESSDFNGWEYSVAPLCDNGFVVTWKERKSRKKEEPLIIKARIFESSGMPRSSSFDVSGRTGSNNGNAVVTGMPNGDFVVSWNIFKVGTYLRVFTRNGKPRTNEILVAPDLDVPSGAIYCGQRPHVYITKSGSINVFMSCAFRMPDEKYLFNCARSFDASGKPLTGILSSEQMARMEGYRRVIEQYVKREAINLGYLRELSGIQRRDCTSHYGSIVKADQMKRFSDDPRMKEFFTSYCAQYRDLCANANEFIIRRIEQCIK